MKINETKEVLIEAIELLSTELPMSREYCQSFPDVYNLQDEYGSDTPYYVYEGGCESDNPSDCINCVMLYFIKKARRIVKERKELFKKLKEK